MRISTHVLDTVRGVPAVGMSVSLERHDSPAQWRSLASAETDRDGRCSQLLPEGEPLSLGTYRLAFNTGSYYREQGMRC
ncbi:MAG: hydroxyisourate hydrolase, partial [Acidobacteria bacterium]|nr:hydroxyisourate hydrolase [Acidobacteriota bacterium]